LTGDFKHEELTEPKTIPTTISLQGNTIYDGVIWIKPMRAEEILSVVDMSVTCRVPLIGLQIQIKSEIECNNM
jgi:hypothetical protein